MIRFLKKITQLQAIWDDFQLIEFVIVYLWGFWVVTLCIRTPLDEKAHQRRRHCGFALWLGIQDSRPSALSLYRWHTTAPADSRSLWNTADIDPTGYCNICTLGKGEVNVMFVTRYTTFLKKVHTWDDVLIECDGITFIKHKEFTAVEAVGELLEVFVNASLQLVNLLAYVLMKKHFMIEDAITGMCMFSLPHSDSLLIWDRPSPVHSGCPLYSTSEPFCPERDPNSFPRSLGSSWISGCQGPNTDRTDPENRLNY